MTTMLMKEKTPFDVIAECLPKTDFKNLDTLNKSVEELLTDRRYCNFLTMQPFWYLDRDLITSVTATYCGEYLEVSVSFRSEESYDNQTVEHVSLPIVYLTDRKTLEQDMAAEKAKQEKQREERERQQYLELQKKYGGHE